MQYARIALLLALWIGIIPAQTFQTISIHPSRLQPGMTGRRMYIGGRGSLTVTDASLASLVILAYGIRPYQLSGPGWMESDRFDITATEPPAATAPQVRIMLRNLLATRFKLAVHRGSKEMPQYQLTVAPGGPLLTNTAPQPPQAAVPGETESREPDALQFESGVRTSIAIGNGG
ncbi:MAG: TIGR03435 family protein, partial [Candidatus Sulfopaludibacter sp.]|nr:TIGR03435 family protein [Candidatus Sulfopaludibacter sp.]